MARITRSRFPLRPFILIIDGREVKMNPFSDTLLGPEWGVQECEIKCDGLKGKIIIDTSVQREYKIETVIPDWFYFVGLLSIIFLFVLRYYSKTFYMPLQIVSIVFILTICLITIIARKRFFRICVK